MKKIKYLLFIAFTGISAIGYAQSPGSLGKSDTCISNKDVDYVVINGLKWDKKNINSKGELMNYHQAAETARKAGKRLPTKEELKALIKSGSSWDDTLKGRWFGEDHLLKSASKKSIFFPAEGSLNEKDGTISFIGFQGHYWSSSPTRGNSNKTIMLHRREALLSNYTHRDGLSVRCIQE